jgi:putative 4-mercaptohistidine N1-methyltranferase
MKTGFTYYESNIALEQYLFFHYGTAKEYLPFPGPTQALNYPSRALELLLNKKLLPANARALDLGCAVGRTSFELTRSCQEVVGIDLSASFIGAAKRMQKFRQYPFSYAVEGDRKLITTLRLPPGVKPNRVEFVTGDAMKIPKKLGKFDVAVLLNLIDRVPDPAKCLTDLTARLNPGAQLIIASPYTWMEEYTPRSKWLGGRNGTGTLDALKKLLTPHYRLMKVAQIPFIIREHARKYQWSMAEGTAWKKLK